MNPTGPRRANIVHKTRASAGHTVRWSTIAIIVGVAVGFAAVIFTSILNWGIDLLASASETMWVYILPVLGLAVSGVVTSTFAPEAAGHGTDAVIKAYNERWGRIRLLVIPVKLLASVLTIAFGGSAGREGPTVQMGGGIGYLIARRLNLPLLDIRRVVVCGMGASFGSIFTAPIAGGIFGAEVLYLEDMQYGDLCLSFISSISGYYTYAIILGRTRLFTFPAPIGYDFAPKRDILFFIVTGIIVGLVSLIFIRTLYGYENLNHALTRIPAYVKTAVGGLLTGLTALAATPYVLGTGIPLVEDLTLDDMFLPVALLVLLAGKIAATSFTIGSGASGGVVAPSLAVGALTGAFVAQIMNYPHPVAVIAASSVGLLGSAAHIPITTTLLAAEVFGMEMVLPATIVSFIGSWTARGDTLYRESYVSRMHLSKASHHFEK